MIRTHDNTKKDCLMEGVIDKDEDEFEQILRLSRIERIDYLERKRNEFQMVRSRLKLLENTSNESDKKFIKFLNQNIEFLLEERNDKPYRVPNGFEHFLKNQLNSKLFQPIIEFYFENI